MVQKKKRQKLEWTRQEIDIVRDGVRRGLSYPQISDELLSAGYKRSGDTTRKFYSKNYGRKIPKKQKLPKATNADYDKTIREMTGLRDKLVNTTLQRFVTMGRPVDSSFKILCISDTHIPFHNPDVIKHALDNHGDADVLVVNGDFLEHYIVSSWPKNKSILFEWEYRMAAEWLQIFAKKFPKVVLVMGNHEKRLMRYFGNQVDPAVSFMVSDDVLTRLADGYDFNANGEFTKMYDNDNVFYDGGDLAHYTAIGKCLFVHPQASPGMVRGRQAIKAVDYFLDREDFHCIVLAHTHKMSSIIHRNKLVIEQGCCCIPMEYELNGKLSMTPQSFGYATIYMNERGSVDFQKSRPVYLGTGTPIREKDPMELMS